MKIDVIISAVDQTSAALTFKLYRQGHVGAVTVDYSSTVSGLEVNAPTTIPPASEDVSVWEGTCSYPQATAMINITANAWPHVVDECYVDLPTTDMDGTFVTVHAMELPPPGVQPHTKLYVRRVDDGGVYLELEGVPVSFDGYNKFKEGMYLVPSFDTSPWKPHSTAVERFIPAHSLAPAFAESSEVFLASLHIPTTFNAQKVVNGVEVVAADDVSVYKNGTHLVDTQVSTVNGSSVVTLTNLYCRETDVIAVVRRNPFDKVYAFVNKASYDDAGNTLPVDDARAFAQWQHGVKYTYSHLNGKDRFFCWVEGAVDGVDGKLPLRVVADLADTLYEYVAPIGDKHVVVGLQLPNANFKVRVTTDEQFRSIDDLTIRGETAQRHEEWQLIRRRQIDRVPLWLWNKLTEAIVGRGLQDGTPVPSKALELADIINGTADRFGIGPGQAFGPKSELLESVKDSLSKCRSVAKIQNWATDAADYAGFMSQLYVALDTQDVNTIFFDALKIAIGANDKYRDVVKTSMLSLHTTQKIRTVVE